MRQILPAVVLLASLGVAPGRASACGGFFCSSSPIDQAGERVLYARESDGSLTMAVEITYSGFDDDFAWIVPVLAPPEISLGTSAMFDALEAVSAPRFGYEQRVEGTCRPYPRCERRDGTEPPPGACGSDTTASAPEYADSIDEPLPDALGGDPGITDGGVTVFSEAPVGPYETVVLGAATAAEVIDWLRARGYDIPSASLPLLEPYAAQGNVFVALRLAANRTTQALRPIVLRSAASEACLPIRLTAIATVPDLPITAFFLGASPVVARNYSAVEIDPELPALYTGGETWAARVGAEADRMGGHAFATDYSGRTPAITVSLPSVADLAGEPDPAVFLSALRERGYAGDALLLEILQRHVVPPAGATDTVYYNCLVGGRGGCGAPSAFDPAGLAATIELEIVRPRAEADALLRRHPRLTRLFTTLSADEMTVDPVFVEDPGAPDVPNLHRAVLVTHCSAGVYADEAAQDLVFGEGTALDLRAGGRAVRVREAVAADATAYCARYDAVPATGTTSTTVRRCGYSAGCSAAGDLPAYAGLSSLLLAQLIGWRVRARRRA